MARVAAIDRLGTELTGYLPLRALVILSPNRPARTIWAVEPVDADQLAGLTVTGRERLASGFDSGEFTSGSALGLAVRAPDSSPLLVFALRGEGEWSADERAVLRFAVATRRADLLEMGDRPRPAAEGPSDLEGRLRAAGDNNEFVLLYQPEVDLRTGQVLAVEALVRWDHPHRGRLAPSDFIELAERSDLIKTLGTWVIDRALDEFAGWRDDRIELRVNVSPAQLSGDGVVGHLAAALARNAIPGGRVCVEFTETAISGDMDVLVATLQSLRAMGVSTALDDLATGYSTLSRLRSLPVDTIKIDRTLVVGIDGDERARAIVRSLLHLAVDLDLQVVAEGIENAREVESLLELGCRRGQGHHFARPLVAAAIDTLLSEGGTLRSGRQ